MLHNPQIYTNSGETFGWPMRQAMDSVWALYLLCIIERWNLSPCFPRVAVVIATRTPLTPCASAQNPTTKGMWAQQRHPVEAIHNSGRYAVYIYIFFSLFFSFSFSFYLSLRNNRVPCCTMVQTGVLCLRVSGVWCVDVRVCVWRGDHAAKSAHSRRPLHLWISHRADSISSLVCW